ncbi:MAG: hypothetical protein O2854_09170 [Chloroflexi bacterium]|nr:hypothetical protein [Chloroflexota bacterium]
MMLRTFVHRPMYMLFAWILVGFFIGLGLGVNNASVWLVAIGLGLFLAFLRWQGRAQWATETPLFWAGPGFMLAWILGFAVHGLAF